MGAGHRRERTAEPWYRQHGVFRRGRAERHWELRSIVHWRSFILFVWQRQHGSNLGGSHVAVPEPTTWIGLLIGARRFILVDQELLSQSNCGRETH